MGIWKSISGQVQVKLTSADLPNTLEALTQQSIPLFQFSYIDDLTVLFWISFRHFGKAKRICKKKGGNLVVQNKRGLYWKLRILLSRPVLVAGILFLIFLTVYFPRHVFFFSVEGNEKLPDRLILNAAQSCSIHFGASRKAVRSEKVKNALLEAIPELQWAGVNTKGCVATISVRERGESTQLPEKHRVTKIIAVCDAVVTSCTVTSGNPMCTVGQAVQKGDTLISGYTDCGLSVLAGASSGEIMGVTNHRIRAIFPLERIVRREKIENNYKFSLIFGKKRINLLDTRGLSKGSCGKITKTYPMRIFGGFTLPVWFEIEEYVKYDEETTITPVSQEQMEAFASEYLISHMISGKILQADFLVRDNTENIYMSGEFFCEEMIGREQSEELIESEQNS